MLSQFQTLRNALKDKYPDMRMFFKEQNLDCPLATERLLGSGVAATKLYQHQSTDANKEGLACFKASEAFITCNDALKMGMRAVDEVLPLLRDLQSSLTGISSLPQMVEFEKVTSWLTTLNGMRAADSLDEAQGRQ